MTGTSLSRCNHCDATKTVCWRKGPSTKPVLCNACGVRYLAKGVNGLIGYMPGHTPRRAFKKRETEVQTPASQAVWHLSHSTIYHGAFPGSQAPILVDAATQTSSPSKERNGAVRAQPLLFAPPITKVDCPLSPHAAYRVSFRRGRAPHRMC